MRGSRSSPRTSSRLISRPTTKKKTVISPSLTQCCRSSVSAKLAPPDREVVTPHVGVRDASRVGPGQRRDRRGEQYDPAERLDRDEITPDRCEHTAHDRNADVGTTSHTGTLRTAGNRPPTRLPGTPMDRVPSPGSASPLPARPRGRLAVVTRAAHELHATATRAVHPENRSRARRRHQDTCVRSGAVLGTAEKRGRDDDSTQHDRRSAS